MKIVKIFSCILLFTNTMSMANTSHIDLEYLSEQSSKQKKNKEARVISKSDAIFQSLGLGFGIPATITGELFRSNFSYYLERLDTVFLYGMVSGCLLSLIFYLASLECTPEGILTNSQKLLDNASNKVPVSKTFEINQADKILKLIEKEIYRSGTPAIEAHKFLADIVEKCQNNIALLKRAKKKTSNQDLIQKISMQISDMETFEAQIRNMISLIIKHPDYNDQLAVYVKISLDSTSSSLA